VLEIAFTLLDRGGLTRIDIEADDLEASSSKRNGKRQSHVAKPDDSDGGFPALDLGKKFFEHLRSLSDDL